MTKFQQKTFSEYYGNKKYRKNWEKIFGKEKKENLKEETEHYETCNTNFDGSCDCGLIDNSDPNSDKKCSNCYFNIDQSPYPEKLMCALVGSSCPKDYFCDNHTPKKEDC